MKASDKHAGGRPTTYSAERAERICLLIIEGKSLRQIAAIDGMPDKATVFRWLAAHPEFRDQYACAREMQAECLADELLQIADDSRGDWVERPGQAGSMEKVVDHENVQRARLRVDTRKWLLSKLQPKKYGDRITQELTGKDGTPLVPVLNVTIAQVKEASHG